MLTKMQSDSCSKRSGSHAGIILPIASSPGRDVMLPIPHWATTAGQRAEVCPYNLLTMPPSLFSRATGAAQASRALRESQGPEAHRSVPRAVTPCDCSPDALVCFSFN